MSDLHKSDDDCTCWPFRNRKDPWDPACPFHGENGTMVVHIEVCPACGGVMYLARMLKGYPKTGPESKRRTCPLHGPLGQYHHLATDRRVNA